MNFSIKSPFVPTVNQKDLKKRKIIVCKNDYLVQMLDDYYHRLIELLMYTVATNKHSERSQTIKVFNFEAIVL